MRMHRVDEERLGLVAKRYEKVYAWVVRDARRYARPRRYEHPRGAVRWVRV